MSVIVYQYMDISETKFEEVNESIKPVLSLDLEDDVLVEQIDKNIDEAREVWDEKTAQLGDINYQYYLGKEKVKLGTDQDTRIVENVIFRNVETIIPIITSSTPEPRLFHPNKKFMDKLRKILMLRWEVTDKMLEKSRVTVRRNFFWYLGVVKVRFDEDEKEVIWETVRNDHVIVDPEGRFVAQIIDDMTLEEVVKTYPTHKEELLKDLGAKAEDKKTLGGKLSFIEFHTPEWTAWKYKNLILDKQKNPNWDWGEETATDEMGEDIKVKYNILTKPAMPYIFFKTFNVKNKIYSDTSLIEQAIPLQDLINKRKRQINENAEEANGSLVGSGDFISKEQFATIKGAARERIWVEKGDARAALARMQGNPMQPYVQDDFVMTKNEIDNIMGTHSTTRGQGGENDTATEAVLQKNQDYGRIDDLVKSYEDFCEDYFNMTLQMMLMHYEEVKLFPLETEDDITLSRDILVSEFSKVYKYKESELRGGQYEEDSDFTKPIVMVKRGSTLPTDDVSKQQNAIYLWGAGGIDPISLYEELNDPNPELKAKRLFLWQQAPQILFPELAKAMGTGQGGATPQEDYTEGMIKDTESLQQGQDPGANRELQDPQQAQLHIQGHSTYMDSEEFNKLDDQMKALYLQHVKAEIAYIKQQKGNGNEQPTA